MIRPKRGVNNSDGLLIQRLRRLKFALRLNHSREVVKVGGIVRMRFANRCAVNVQRLPVKALGLVIPPLRLNHPREVVKAVA